MSQQPLLQDPALIKVLRKTIPHSYEYLVALWKEYPKLRYELLNAECVRMEEQTNKDRATARMANQRANANVSESANANENANANGDANANAKKKRPCFNWRDYGTCERGDRCRFDHDPSEKGINMRNNKKKCGDCGSTKHDGDTIPCDALVPGGSGPAQDAMKQQKEKGLLNAFEGIRRGLEKCGWEFKEPAPKANTNLSIVTRGADDDAVAFEGLDYRPWSKG